MVLSVARSSNGEGSSCDGIGLSLSNGLGPDDGERSGAVSELIIARDKVSEALGAAGCPKPVSIWYTIVVDQRAKARLMLGRPNAN